MLKIKKSLHLYLLLFLGVMLSACGGSDSASTPAATATLSGTAAVGAALANRQVSIVDNSGSSITTLTDASGNYSVSVTVSAKPFMLKVETDGEPLYSFAAEAGITNISPLTNLALHEASKNGVTYAPLSGLFSAFASRYQEITETRLSEAKAKVNANLATAYSSAGVANGFDVFKTAFEANGLGIDKVLDDTGIVIDSASPGNISITVTGVGAFAFDAGIDFSQFVVGGSGGDSSGLPSYVASQIVDMEFCCAAQGAPYVNGEIVKFTFSGSGALFLTESFTEVSATFTDNSTTSDGPYVWDNGTYRYELSVLNNAIHEVNLSTSSGTFQGQFTPSVTGGSTGSAAQYTLTISGNYVDSGFGVSVPVNLTLNGPFVAPDLTSVEDSVRNSYGASGTVSVTAGVNTEAQKVFTVSFTGTGSPSPLATGALQFNLTYTYNKI